MSFIYGVQSWVRIHATLPSFPAGQPFSKPNKISTVETIVNEYTGEQLIEIALSNQDLFGGAVLDAERVRALNPDDVLAYYLNVRYNASMPTHLLPIRNGAMYGKANHLYAWYLLMSAILTKLYDGMRSTIDKHKLYRADQLARTLAQVNYVIWEYGELGNARTYPDILIIGAARITDKSGITDMLVFDAEKFEQWTAGGGTPESALAHWKANHTQPM